MTTVLHTAQRKPLEVHVVEQGAHRFIEASGSMGRLENVGDIVDLIGICAENHIDQVVLHGSILPDQFFDLRSGLAGAILQKLVDYQIKTAAILSIEQVRGKFGEFVVETNHGRHFRVFFDREKAVRWLLNT